MAITPISGTDTVSFINDPVGNKANALVVIPVNADGSAMGGGSSTSPSIAGGEYNSSPPALSNGQTDALQLSSSGELLSVPRISAAVLSDALSTTVNLPAGASSSGVLASLTMRVVPYIFNGTSFDRQRGDTTGAFIVETPTGSASNALTVSATSAVASSLVLKASAGNLYGYNIVAGASAGYLMIFNATSAPADGAVTPTLCIPVAANAGLERQFAKPLRFTTGITMVFSTTGPFTKTASATAFLAGEAL